MPVGFMTPSVLMLDCDNQREDVVTDFAREYTKFHGLGSVLVMKTSDSEQLTFSGRPLGNYATVFGKLVPRKESRWHIREAFRLGKVDKSFVATRNFDHGTTRVNAKNREKPYPEIVYYFSNGDNTGVMAFLRFWVMCRNLGEESMVI